MADDIRGKDSSWRTTSIGDEEGQAKIFLDRLLQSSGHALATSAERVSSTSKNPTTMARDHQTRRLRLESDRRHRYEEAGRRVRAPGALGTPRTPSPVLRRRFQLRSVPHQQRAR